MHSRAKGRVKKLLKNFKVLWINPGCETVKRATVQYHLIFFFNEYKFTVENKKNKTKTFTRHLST